MNDSIKYGPSLGIILFLSEWLIALLGFRQFGFLEVLILMSFGLGISYFFILKSNSTNFSFQIAWLSGFNVVFVASLIQAVLIFLIGELFLEDANTNYIKGYLAFTRFLTTEFIGIVVVTVISLILKRGK